MSRTKQEAWERALPQPLCPSCGFWRSVGHNGTCPTEATRTQRAVDEITCKQCSAPKGKPCIRTHYKNPYSIADYYETWRPHGERYRALKRADLAAEAKQRGVTKRELLALTRSRNARVGRRPFQDERESLQRLIADETHALKTWLSQFGPVLWEVPDGPTDEPGDARPVQVLQDDVHPES